MKIKKIQKCTMLVNPLLLVQELISNQNWAQFTIEHKHTLQLLVFQRTIIWPRHCYADGLQ